MATKKIVLTGADGATPTTGQLIQTGLGNAAFYQTGTLAYEADCAAHDAMGLLFTGRRYVQWYTPSSAESNQAVMSLVITTPATWPTGTTPIISPSNDLGACFNIAYGGTSGQLQIQPPGGSWTTLATGLTTNTKYRITIRMNAADLAASSGTCIVKVYSYASGAYNTAVGSGYTSTTATFARRFAGFMIGPNVATATTLGVSDIQWDIGTTTEIGDWEVPLAAPSISVSHTDPSTIGGSNGTATVTWGAVAGAHHYESCLVEGTVTSGFTADDTAATSPKVYTGLDAGVYTIAVRTKAS